MSDKTRGNNWLPRAPGNRHSRVGIHSVITRHSDSTMRTHINAKITVISDKLAELGRDSQEIRSTRDTDGQHQNGSPFLGALHLLERWRKATLASIVRQDRTVAVKKPCYHVCQL
jgi:hypothetical protein